MNMKLLVFFLFAFIISLVSGSDVLANEGRVVLKNGDIKCEGISVWERSDYNITGKCFGLVYPYSEQLDSYVIWVKLEDGEIKRIGSVDEGLFDGAVNKRFSALYITAETDSSPRQAGKIIVSGDIQKFSNRDNTTTSTLSTPAPTTKPEEFLQSPSPTVINKVNISKAFSTATITGIIIIGLVILIVLFVIRKR